MDHADPAAPPAEITGETDAPSRGVSPTRAKPAKVGQAVVVQKRASTGLRGDYSAKLVAAHEARERVAAAQQPAVRLRARMQDHADAKGKLGALDAAYRGELGAHYANGSGERPEPPITLIRAREHFAELDIDHAAVAAAAPAADAAVTALVHASAAATGESVNAMYAVACEAAAQRLAGEFAEAKRAFMDQARIVESLIVELHKDGSGAASIPAALQAALQIRDATEATERRIEGESRSIPLPKVGRDFLARLASDPEGLL